MAYNSHSNYTPSPYGKANMRNQTAQPTSPLQRFLWGFALFNIVFLAVTAATYYEHLIKDDPAVLPPRTSDKRITARGNGPRRDPNPMPTIIKLKPESKPAWRYEVDTGRAKAPNKSRKSAATRRPVSPRPVSPRPATPRPATARPATARPTAPVPAAPRAATAGADAANESAAVADGARLTGRLGDSRALGLPAYQILHASTVGGDKRRYAEVLIPRLSPATPTKELRRVAKGIVKAEELDSLVVYCTPEARTAQYSMSYSDEHPDALKNGLLCYIERGWFKRAGPKEWGLSRR